MKKDRLLILFSKWPRKGISKSRFTGPEGKVDIEKFCFACLDDLIHKVRDLKGVDLVVVPNTSEESLLFSRKYGVFSLGLEQMGISLGNSKSQIFSEVFNYFLDKYSKVCLIPMDIPHIDPSTIRESFNKLEEFDSVFGPESNGGVYLMGLNGAGKENVFQDVRWSTKDSFSDLVNNSSNSAVLEYLFDLNTFDDLKYLKGGMLEGCPNLKRFIKPFMSMDVIVGDRI